MHFVSLKSMHTVVARSSGESHASDVVSYRTSGQIPMIQQPDTGLLIGDIASLSASGTGKMLSLGTVSSAIGFKWCGK